VATGDTDHLRFFPKAAPYDAQAEAMDRIRTAIEGGRDVLFEGACGTGKTLAALAPALDVARRTNRTVVITTNVHQQMRQFIEEAREINASEPLRAVVFRGKASMCHIDVGYEECQVLREATYNLVDTERDLSELEREASDLLEAARAGDEDAAARRQSIMAELEDVQAEVEDLRESTTCDHYYRNLTDGEAVREFEDWLFADVRTPDEVYEWAGTRGLCGYELLKDGLEAVDLVVCNYHHLLDPHIRTQFLQWLGREPGDIIGVFDEAHNLEAAARDHAARHLTERTVSAALDELSELSDRRADAASNVLGAFQRALVDVYEDEISDTSVDEDWQDVPVKNSDRRDDLTLGFLDHYAGPGIEKDLTAAVELGRELDDRYERAYRRGEATRRQECQTLQCASFISAYLEESAAEGIYPTVGVRRDGGTGDVYGRAELYTCIPRRVTEGLFEQLSASVLMSATLRPFDVLEASLGLDDPETMAFGLSFPEENRRTVAVDVPPLYSSQRDDPSVQRTVADSLADAVRYTAGNTLAYFPSYREAARYHQLLGDRIDTPRYLDEPGTRAKSLREEFVSERDGVLCTSVWGTLTEGVSFDGSDARSVVVIGVPYPHLDERAQAVQEAYDSAVEGENTGWRYAVEIPTIRKTRQALGRVIRSPDELGVRMLFDRRYTASGTDELGEYSVYDTLPPELRSELIDVAPEKLRFTVHNFFTDHGAWHGEPPEL
jgi:DNA excision repair protein ERCC-2